MNRVTQSLIAIGVSVVVVACSASSESGGAVPAFGDPLAAIDTETALRAAVVIGTCVPDDRVDRNLAVLHSVRANDQYYRWVRGAAKCLATRANGCQAAADCGLAVQKGTCTGGGRCDGNVAVGCDSPIEFRLDCGRIGLACTTQTTVGSSNGTETRLERSACTQPGLAKCEEAGFVSACEDGAPTECNDGVRGRGVKCADFGLVCGADPMAGTSPSPPVMCRGTGAACTTNDPYARADLGFKYAGVGCDGAKLKTCVGGAEHTIDCATIGAGLTCQSVPGGSSFCGLAAECDPQQVRAACDGDAMVVCNAGKLSRVDCKSLGFSGCNAAKKVCAPSPWD